MLFDSLRRSLPALAALTAVASSSLVASAAAGHGSFGFKS